MGETIRLCPGCGAEMNEVFKWSMAIDVCTKCEGAFFDFKEMSSVIETTESTKDVSKEILKWDDNLDHEGKHLTCAGCQTPMTEKEYLYNSWVYINFCEKCYSAYLDKGELEEIKNYVTSLDQSVEWIEMEKKWLAFADTINKQTQESYLKLRKELDGMYWTDNLIWMNRVVDFIFNRFF